MITQTRRTMLFGTTSTFALAACGNTENNVITAAENDLLLVDNAVLQIVQETQPNSTALISDLTLAKTGLTALINGTTPPLRASTPAQIVGLISSDLNTLAPIISMAFPASMPYVIAAQVLLATASALLGSPTATPTAASVGALKPHSTPPLIPTPDQARVLLKSYVRS